MNTDHKMLSKERERWPSHGLLQPSISVYIRVICGLLVDNECAQSH
jgi:hypothetical protein